MNQPMRYPQYLPFPTPVVRKGWMPVQQSVNWPSAQFAPRYAQGGSVQPFYYPDGSGTRTLYSGPEAEENPGFFRSTWDTMPTAVKVVAALGGAYALYAWYQGYGAQVENEFWR